MLARQLTRIFNASKSNLGIRYQATEPALNIKKLEEESSTADASVDEEAQLREESLKQSQNKSRLNASHRNVVHDNPPYSEPQHWSHGTLKYQQKMYARYGSKYDFDPSLCWNKEEIRAKQEYEAIKYPQSVTELIHMAQEKRKADRKKIELRQAEIEEKMKKNKSWIDELHKKMAKKEADALAAKERKDSLIEEVRRHFGYTVDPKDDRFKEMLEKKEKEQKKAMKEARKKAKEDIMVAKLTTKGKDVQAPKENIEEN